MSRPKDATSNATLARIERELERIGVLLQHDAELPSFSALVAGEPIRGSWWSHELAHPIYDLLQVFHDTQGQLSVKLINGKVTYVHRRLWPALLTLIRTADPKRVRDVSKTAQILYDRAQDGETLRADQLRKTGFATAKVITSSIRELELKLLVHTDEIHTESGAHAKVLTSWAEWATAMKVAAGKMSREAAAAELDQAVAVLCAKSGGKAKLPW